VPLRPLATFAASLAALAAGCAAKPEPYDALRSPNPALRRITADYTTLVERIHDRPGEIWHHNWTGNILPNTLGDRFGQKGLCHQWQEEVWLGIQPSLARERWAGVGIAANVGEYTEHHAVIIYNPEIIAREELLQRSNPQAGPRSGPPHTPKPPPRFPTPAWVLDPWHTGTPAVYSLDEWLVRGTAEWFSVELEILPPPPNPAPVVTPSPAQPAPPRPYP